MLIPRIIYNQSSKKYLIHFDGHLIEEYSQQLQKIAEDYEIEGLFLHPTRKDKIKHKHLRICRYCHKTYPDTTFNKIAHIIPELMGNDNLISDDECDSCNHLFSKYEDSFANFLGIARTLSGAKGKEGIPTFKNPDKMVEARKNESSDGVLLQFKDLHNEEYYEIDESRTKLTVKVKRHTYIPLYVYKCLLKIAFGLLNDNALPLYKICEKFLLSHYYDNQVKGHPYLRLFGFYCPGPLFTSPAPFVIIWKMKESKDGKNIPTRIMVIHFQNYVFQIFIPFGPKDEEINQIGKQINFNFIPPFLDAKWIKEFGKPSIFHIDMSSNIPIKGDNQNVTLTFSEPIPKDFPR